MEYKITGDPILWGRLFCVQRWVRMLLTSPLSMVMQMSACAAMSGMATFAEAAIQDDYLDPIRAADSFTVKRP